ncbi:MAG: YSC84-related protein, partial [Phycisphaerales bacterium]
TDPSLNVLLTGAKGYAVFPDIGKAGLVLGGAYGKGEVFQGSTQIGFCDLTQGSIGLQIGAQSYSEVVVFLTDREFANFKAGSYAFAANVSAVALSAGAAGKADYAKGVIVLVETRGGLMAEASVGGQKFSYLPK